jgi:hypothetical protein
MRTFFHVQRKFEAKSIISPPQKRPICHEIGIHAWQYTGNKYHCILPVPEWPGHLAYDDIVNYGVTFRCEIWSAFSCCFFWVQGSFEDVTSRQTHSTGSDFRLTLDSHIWRWHFSTKGHSKQETGLVVQNSVFCSSDISPAKCTCTYILLFRLVMTKEADRKTIYQHYFLMVFYENKSSEADSFIYWDFFILMSTKMNVRRLMKIMTGCEIEKWFW